MTKEYDDPFTDEDAIAQFDDSKKPKWVFIMQIKLYASEIQSHVEKINTRYERNDTLQQVKHHAEQILALMKANYPVE